MRKGFTLLELLIVVVILGVLALIATPAMLNAVDQTKEGAVKANVSTAASTVTSQFALNTTDDTATIAQNVVDKLNTNNKNPLTGADNPYATTGTAPGTVVLTPGTQTDASTNTTTAIITLVGYGKSGNAIITKTVAAPASSN